MAPASKGVPPPDPLRVRVLGGFAVDGLDERSLGSRKARVLLRRLAVELGKSVSVDALVDAVWAEHRPSDPGGQLSVLVSRLRVVLGVERLPRSDLGYSLAADEFDATTLRRHVEVLEERLQAGEHAAALATGRLALAVAAGPLLPEEDADWVQAARTEVERLVSRAHRAVGEAALALGQNESARAAALSVLDHDPYDESALRLAMRADAFAGRPGAALAAYAEVQRRLAEDLGVDPDPQTRDLHTLIVQGRLAPLEIRRDRGAPMADRLVGRDGQLATLDRLLFAVASGGVELAVIEGAAGLGKSTLLATWGASAQERALVLRGACDELGADVPLQPIFDGLSAHLAGLGRQRATEVLGPELALLSAYLAHPESVTGQDQALATTVADPEQGRFALFSALTTVLARAAGSRPLVLVVDDLHRAAAGTVELLTFAARRLDRLLVVAARRPEPGPDLPRAVRIPLALLTITDVEQLIDQTRAGDLHRRSGGNPLFLSELAAATEGDPLPDTIVAAVRRRVEALGGAAATAEAAAACGSEVDVELVAAVVGRPVALVLDDLQQMTTAGLLRPRDVTLSFAHELVRDAVETSLTGPRRMAIHRSAVSALSARPQADPLQLARHARLAGDPTIAAASLIRAAQQASRRYESTAALELLDESIALADSIEARLLRGRLRLAALDLAGAGDDASSAIDLDAGVRGFELAGWVAYYSRDYETALRYADEGVARGSDDELRASCLSLAGRIRHTRGDLRRAGEELGRALSLAPAGVRAIAQVWTAQLCAHRGDVEEAVDLARRGVLDPHLGHPFAGAHGHFTLSYASAIGGRWAQAWVAAADLDDLISRTGDRRFQPVAANLRGWLLRGAGLVDRSREEHARAATHSPGPTFREAHYAALLDLVECELAMHDHASAAEALAQCAGIALWSGSMQWRHLGRYRLLEARVRAASGRSGAAEAMDAARDLSHEAGLRGDRRYAARGGLYACAFAAWCGRPPSVGQLTAAIDDFVPLAGPDGWRDLDQLAIATGSQLARSRAEEVAGAVLDQVRRAGELAPTIGLDVDVVAGALRRGLDRT